MADFVREIKIALKTGKVAVGSRQVMSNLTSGKGKLVILARNAPDEMRSRIENLASVSNIPIFRFEGSGWELGTVCEKPFMVAALSVMEPGDSEILQVTEGT